MHEAELRNLKVIALVDTLWGGHHNTYLKFFSKTLLDLGHEVVAMCPEPDEMNQWIACHCPDHINNFHSYKLTEPEPIRLLPPRLQNIVLAVLRWQRAAQSIQMVASKLGKIPDLVFFAWLDTYMQPLLIPAIVNRLFPYKWSGLYFQPRHLREPLKFQRILRGSLNPISVLKSSLCPVIAVLDEGVADKLQQKTHKSVVIFPDFADPSPPDLEWDVAKKIVEKASGRKIVTLLGTQGKYKGLLTFIEVSQTVKSGWLFVFAGRFLRNGFTATELTRINNIVSANPSNCFFYLTRIPTESQYNALVWVSDVLFAVHENFPFSSNTLTKAALFEKPVIAGEKGCMGERINKFNLGYKTQEKNIAQNAVVLKKLYDELSVGKLSVQPKFEEYRQIHSIEQLTIVFQKLLSFV